ncbi:FAD-dependent oxidoreductase [Actinomycetota bacterium]
MNKKDIYEYDIVIIGGGISGCEASYISATKGAKVLMLSINTDGIGSMAFGNYISIEKGIAALGKDIWKRLVLNASARKTRIGINCIKNINKESTSDILVVNRKRFRMTLKEIIESHKNIKIRQGLVVDIDLKSNNYHTMTSDDTSYKSKAIILAPGTFLDSSIFWGSYNIEAGRPGEITSKRLLKNLIKKGFKFKETKLYSGAKIDGRSLELEKYINNSEKQKLNIMPEGVETNEMYVDGLNDAKSEEVQLKVLRKINGMKNIVMTRPGYGIKYNILSPLQINKDLESIKFPGLFFCGRINGISEYESTAAQGYSAGLNAFKKIKK